MEGIIMRKSKITWMFIIMIFLLFGLTGCSKVVLETEEQNNKAAEYLAGVLLNHSTNYKEELIYEDENKKEEASNLNQETSSPTNELKETEVPKKDTESNGKQTKKETKKKEIDLNEVFKLYGVDVTYKSYKFYSEYSKPAWAWVAKKGKKLLALEFEVKNTKKDKNQLDLLSEGIMYYLEIGDGVIYEPNKTSLLEDIQFLQLNMKKAEVSKAILFFEVEESVETKSGSMYLNIGEKKNSVARVKIN